jgi:hypothetical protein
VIRGATNTKQTRLPELARNGPSGPVWRSPLLGEDRKSAAYVQTDANDPERLSDLQA